MLELFYSIVLGAAALAIFFLLGIAGLAFILLIAALLIVFTIRALRLIKFLLPVVFALIVPKLLGVI
ncbi:hypothetical protein A2833_03060 [Candidatus Azambacteria bacterium RIFCSPHIGHO2_01_FULL_44_55]|uniref:Uncharacterized protein n=1 Tax=Candidatus Azambacteria bacterium RIFCSPLOWO2_02_FULL_44_14 TaxID=1797306 RepID=A0A1F5CBE0_9BACT|nr:MAG: hypothetical protein A3A18_02375 [Candidatus Azambacteria bacterium RIFCSPLOWO2_01_FULL_44_84]OGD32710.1 MAG: hypothetical protein A3C78_01790 [Candidatus Azambacteria bacterium RIFCSPHIGHO2_02_FULL_45_18]OGD40163.1 MAG: hypothetical protein A3I30_02755 [Candidatus Azambacteria bacterium RIFCSPLOWO2_02_FULL_44_14]OGD41695.1 MAG: hypothetical protein A2833_03060 [Candidatus Azambacteria bacterium RIFCSPHIGHO2_01_FULL_44_55]OGD50084.1 MAG: hypothetical protein A2608_03495 [Candidatus Azam